MYSIRRHAGINNYESGCILQSSITHHVVSIMTEFRIRIGVIVYNAAYTRALVMYVLQPAVCKIFRNGIKSNIILLIK